MRKVFLVLLNLLILSSQSVYGEEAALKLEPSQKKLPLLQIGPDYTLTGGYRFVDLDGSERAREYDDHHDSVSFGGEIRAHSTSHRFHVKLDELNRNDYFGDLGYGYRDILLTRWIRRSLFHNLENIRLVDLDPATPSPGVDVRDGRQEYGERVGINEVSLRAKMPDFPLHVYLLGGSVRKEGDRQQRSILGDGWFLNTVRNTQMRDVDWRTKTYALGLNGHFGPIEADYAHSEKRFESGGDDVLFDTYGAAGFPAGSVRAGGDYPHNRIPDIKTSSDVLKIHSSYTGKIVATATLSAKDKTNRHSGARAEYLIGSGGLAWMPFTQLTCFLKYRRTERDLDHPASVTIADRSNPGNSYSDLTVKNAISSTMDRVTGTIRYRPTSKLTLRAEYLFEDVHRDNADEWDGVESTTRKNRLKLSGEARIMKGLKLKASYAHKEIDDPAYNTVPNRSNEGSVSISWMPNVKISTLFRYDTTREERNDPYYESTVEPREREVSRDRVHGTVTYLLYKNLSMTTSYTYLRDEIEQDMTYFDTTPVLLTDWGVPYENLAHHYSFHLFYKPIKKISIHGGIAHTTSRGDFDPKRADLLSPVSIASFSGIRVKETTYSLSGEMEWKDGILFAVDFEYNDFNDILDAVYDDVEDGIARSVLLRMSRKW